jgi:hypothetical protein
MYPANKQRALFAQAFIGLDITKEADVRTFKDIQPELYSKDFQYSIYHRRTAI